MPKISIIVPIYNVENYLSKCIDSILDQSFGDYEIILVNDGSTDNSGNIINKYHKKDKRIIAVHKENRGVSQSRNIGIKYSKGQYILFLDPDDWLEKNALDLLNSIIDKKEYDIVQFKYIINDINSNKVMINIDNSIFDNDNLLNMTLVGKNIFSVWSKLIKREFILKNNIYFNEDISYGEDLLYTATMIMYKPKYIFIDEFLYNYYKRENSLSRTKNNKLLDITKAIYFLKQNLLQNKLYELYKLEYDYLAYMQCFFYLKDIIYEDDGNLGKKLFKAWKLLNIRINNDNNIYYKNLYINDNCRSNIVLFIYERNYSLGRILYKFLNK